MASGSSWSSRADHSAGQDCDLGTPAELPGRHPAQLDRFQSSAIVVTNPTYEFDVARILLILMRPAIRNRRAERFELVSAIVAQTTSGENVGVGVSVDWRALIPSMHCRLAEEVP